MKRENKRGWRGRRCELREAEKRETQTSKLREERDDGRGGREGREKRDGVHMPPRHSRAALIPGSLRLFGGARAAAPQSRQARSFQRAQPGCLCMLMRQSRTASHTIAPSVQELTRLQNDGAQLPGWGGGDPLQRGLASRYPALTG